LVNAYRISLVVEVSDTRCEWADRSVWHDLHVGIVEKSMKFELECLESFKDFLLVNMRLEKTTVRETLQDARRFLEASKCVVSYDAVKRYLESYVGKKPKTYNSQITSLRRFLRDFLKVPDAIMSFKMAAVDEWHFNENLPSKEQVRQGFMGLKSARDKALYLFTASTGLRKSEILGLLKSQVNHETHLVLAQHFTRKKRSGITFYDDEVSELLGKYLSERNDNSDKLFPISESLARNLGKGF